MTTETQDTQDTQDAPTAPVDGEQKYEALRETLGVAIIQGTLAALRANAPALEAAILSGDTSHFGGIVKDPDVVAGLVHGAVAVALNHHAMETVAQSLGLTITGFIEQHRPALLPKFRQFEEFMHRLAPGTL